MFLQDNFTEHNIEKLIRENNIPVERLSSKELTKIKHAKDLQGIVARVGKFEYSSFDDLPVELIRARIALGYTQKKLAARVGLKEQQIQRYEETEYSTASFSRLKEIIEALGLDVKEKIVLSKEAVK